MSPYCFVPSSGGAVGRSSAELIFEWGWDGAAEECGAKRAGRGGR